MAYLSASDAGRALVRLEREAESRPDGLLGRVIWRISLIKHEQDEQKPLAAGRSLIVTSRSDDFFSWPKLSGDGGFSAYAIAFD